MEDSFSNVHLHYLRVRGHPDTVDLAVPDGATHGEPGHFNRWKVNSRQAAGISEYAAIRCEDPSALAQYE